jgi:hypothetical protein
MAAITAALAAAGLLPGFEIRRVRPLGGMSPWKRAGLISLMEQRELGRFRKQ